MDALESYIKLIYERWFVQYDFPDKNGNPYKSSGGKMIWSDKALQEFAVTVDAVEKVTGLDFFSKVPKEQQKYLESSFSIKAWQGLLSD